jgi:hypothetical protein
MQYHHSTVMAFAQRDIDELLQRAGKWREYTPREGFLHTHKDHVELDPTEMHDDAVDSIRIFTPKHATPTQTGEFRIEFEDIWKSVQKMAQLLNNSYHHVRAEIENLCARTKTPDATLKRAHPTHLPAFRTYRPLSQPIRRGAHMSHMRYVQHIEQDMPSADTPMQKVECSETQVTTLAQSSFDNTLVVAQAKETIVPVSDNPVVRTGNVYLLALRIVRKRLFGF